MVGDNSKRSYTPYRLKLFYSVSAVITLIALIVVPIEVFRPYEELGQLISNAKNLITGIQTNFRRNDVAELNRFTLRVLPETKEVEEDQSRYLILAFNMLSTEGLLLPEEAVLAKLTEAEQDVEEFDYARLQEAAAFWEKHFAEQPGVLELFREFKRTLIRAKERAREVPFVIADAYIMLDSGEKVGVFEKGIVFVVDGYQWWEDASFPSMLYEIEDNAFWRRSALAGRSEFDNNPESDQENWFLPRFDVDEWGTWFSVWKTEDLDENFNIVTIDFDATSVKKTMVRVLATVIAVGTLVLALVIAMTTALSRLITRPVTELRRGSEEVAKGNYDYQVPVLKEDELGELTKQFNQMTAGQKERLNLKATLEKLLSKELAEQAGQQGLMLGGKKTNCTLMFTDFAGFSTISQHLSPNDAVAQLNQYFETLIPIIKKHGGFPDKYIGDAIVAIFGAPIHFGDHGDKAVRCAVEMQRALRALNKLRRERKKPVFEMRVGINSGEVIVGAIGCDMKLEYTSIGETTNLANRMESACNIGHVMITEATHSVIDLDSFTDVRIDRDPVPVYVKGYAEPISAYRIQIDETLIEKQIGDTGADIYRYGRLSGFFGEMDGLGELGSD